MDRGGRHLGDDRERPDDAHPHPSTRAEVLERDDGSGPGVARAAVRLFPVEDDRVGRDDHHHVARVRSRRGHDGLTDADMAAVGAAAIQVDAHQLGDIFGARAARDVVGGSDLYDLAAFQDEDAIGECEGVDGVVCDEDARAAEATEDQPELPACLGPGLDVERGERFVEQKESRLGRERAGDGDALRLTARQLARTGGRLCRHSDLGEERPGTRPSLGAPNAVFAESERDVVERTQMFEQQVVLEHDADGSLLGRHEASGRGIVDDGIADADATVVEWEQAGERSQQCCLTRAIRTEHREQLAVAHPEVGGERERTDRDAHGRVDAHSADSQRSRRLTSTAREITSNTRLRTIAGSMLPSSSLT